MSTLVLCGAGNSEGVRLAQHVNRASRRWDRIVLLDDDPAKADSRLLGVPVVGPIGALDELGVAEVVNLVARTTSGRRRVAERLDTMGAARVDLLAADVDLDGVSWDPDLTAYPHVTLGPEATLGRGTVVFMGATIGHECRVGAYCVVAANAVLNARVVLEDGVYVGSNATVLPEIRIGAGATIGAGSAVIDDVPPGATVVGVPGEVFLPGVRPAGPGASQGMADAPPEVEQQVGDVVAAVLERSAVGLEENFFDLGGTSLLALRVARRLQEAFGRDVCLVDLFQYPTVRTLAARMADGMPGLSGLAQARARGAGRRRRLLHGVR